MTTLPISASRRCATASATGTFSAREVARRVRRQGEQAKALNAFIVETPDHAIAAAKDTPMPRAPRAIAQAAGRRADRHEGPVRHQGRADDRGEPYPGGLQAGL
jgi:hypothetical protein